jgi:ethanolamine permease
MADTIAPALDRLLGLSLPDPLWWALLYGIFAWINIYGVALFFRVAATLCFSALAVLALFWTEALPFFELHLALNTPAQAGGTPWLPNGLAGVAWALPFAIWFYINIEQAPLACEETKRPERVMPRALLYGMLILVIAALLTLFLNSGVSPGAEQVGKAKDALLVAFQNVLVFNVPYVLLPFLYLIGLTASFHTSIYAFSRSLYVLSRAGYIPSELSLTHRTRLTPHYAIIVGTVFSYAMALVIELSPGDSHVALLLLNMSVFSALISYVFTMSSYVILARDHPDMERPFVSPLGATGAITALGIAIAAIVLLFHNPDYRPGLYGAAAILIGGIVYFMLRRRHRLVASPEETFALELERRSKATSTAAAPAIQGA